MRQEKRNARKQRWPPERKCNRVTSGYQKITIMLFELFFAVIDYSFKKNV